MQTNKDFDKATHYLLQTLWSKAVGTPDYYKKEWIELQNRISTLQLDRNIDGEIRAASSPYGWEK